VVCDFTIARCSITHHADESHPDALMRATAPPRYLTEWQPTTSRSLLYHRCGVLGTRWLSPSPLAPLARLPFRGQLQYLVRGTLAEGGYHMLRDPCRSKNRESSRKAAEGFTCVGDRGTSQLIRNAWVSLHSWFRDSSNWPPRLLGASGKRVAPIKRRRHESGRSTRGEITDRWARSRVTPTASGHTHRASPRPRELTRCGRCLCSVLGETRQWSVGSTER